MRKVTTKNGAVKIFIDFRVKVHFETPALSQKIERIRKEIQQKIDDEISGFEVFCEQEMIKRPLPDEAVGLGVKLDMTKEVMDKLMSFSLPLKNGEVYLAMDYESKERLKEHLALLSTERIQNLNEYMGTKILTVDKPSRFIKLLKEV